MSKQVKDNLAKIQLVIVSLIAKAEEDGIVTKEEANILETAKENLNEYEKMVEIALKDDIITQEEMNTLIDLEEKLLSDSYFTAMNDDIINKDELLLLKTLINSIDKNASVSWLDEDTA